MRQAAVSFRCKRCGASLADSLQIAVHIGKYANEAEWSNAKGLKASGVGCSERDIEEVRW